MLSTSLLMLLFCCGLLAPAPAPAQPASGSEKVVCRTCGGDGRATMDCWLCEGVGAQRCPQCTDAEFKHPARWVKAWLPAALIRAFAEDLVEQAEGLITTHFPRGMRPRLTKLKDGEQRCPARCWGGKLPFRDEWVDCKLCRGGKFRCTFCKQGRVPCHNCDGTGKIESACDDCAGVGRVPDPTSLATETCPWCLGTNQRPCRSCDDSGRVPLPCGECQGNGQKPCPDCKGVGRYPCSKCDARGRQGTQKMKCDKCRMKGSFPCRTCDRGTVPCSTCAEEPVAPVECPHCGGKKKHPCNGCNAGAYLAWERTGEWFLQEEEPARAKTWFEAARLRCEKRYDEFIESFDKDEKLERRAKFISVLKGERKQELERLDRLLGEAGEAEKAAGEG